MGIRFACHACSKGLNIKQELAGKRGICPACSTRFRIPLQSSEHSSPVEEKSKTMVAGTPNDPSHRAQQSSAERDSGKQATPSNRQGDSPQPKDIVTGDLKQIDAMIDDPEATWYVRPPSGGQYGPADSAVLRQWIDEGRVAATALLWRDGWPQWRTASETLPGLAMRLPGKPGTTEENSKQTSDTNLPKAGDPEPGSNKAKTAPNHAFRETESLPSRNPEIDRSPTLPGAVTGVDLDRPNVVSPSSELESDLTGDQSIGTQRRRKTNRRILTIGMLSVIVAALLGVLVFLMNQ